MLNNTYCGYSDGLLTFIKGLEFTGSTILTFVDLIFGVPGHIIAFITFLKQRGDNRAYTYQMFGAVSETFEALAHITLSATEKHWSNMDGEGVEWYTSNYYLQWHAAKLGSLLLQISITNSLLLSLCMSIDRLVAMSRPFAYKQMNHKLYHILAVFGCAIISIATSMYDYGRMVVEERNHKYYVVGSVEYTATNVPKYLSFVQIGVRMVAVVCVCVCDARMLYLYRRQRMKVTQMKAAGANDPKEMKKKAAEHTLIVLSVSQGVINFVGVSTVVLHFALIYSVEGFVVCGHSISSPIALGYFQLADVLEFYLILLISKQFRAMVRDIFPCKKGNVHAISGASSAVTQQAHKQQATATGSVQAVGQRNVYVV